MKQIFLLSILASGAMAYKGIKGKELNPVSVQLIRNATLKFDYNGTTWLVDPALGPKHSMMSFVTPDQNLNPTVNLPIAVDSVTEGVEAVLVTHMHPDHFDEEAMTVLSSDLPLFIQPFDQAAMAKSPFKQVTTIENKTNYKGTTIIRTGGKHGPDELLEGLGEVSGFILQAKGYPTVYIVGDCLWDDDIKSTITTYQPDIIVLNSGGAQWGGAQILMNEQDAVEVAKFAPQAKVIAVHMEALDHCQTTREKVKTAAVNAKVDIVVPDDGATLTF